MRHRRAALHSPPGEIYPMPHRTNRPIVPAGPESPVSCIEHPLSELCHDAYERPFKNRTTTVPTRRRSARLAETIPGTVRCVELEGAKLFFPLELSDEFDHELGPMWADGSTARTVRA